MSFFLDDKPQGKKPKQTGPVDYFTGLPVRQYPKPQDSPTPKRKQEPTPTFGQSAHELVKSGREMYAMGKGIYNSVSPKNKYLHRPRDYDEVMEKRKTIRKMNKESSEYHRAKREIEEYEQQRQEYEASKPKGRLSRFLRR